MDQIVNCIKNDLKSSKNIDKIEKVIFDIVLKHIKDLIYMMKVDEKNKAFSYVFLNEAALNYASLDSSCIGKTLQDVLPAATAAHLQEKYQMVIDERKAICFQDQIVFDNGTIMYGESILSPIYDKDSIRYIVSVTRDITDSVNEKKLIEFMAYHDSLSGLPNRSSLKESLDSEVSAAKEKGDSLAVMYLDLDRFKFLNDTFGHNFGDLLLKNVADRLLSITEEGYKIFRQGGDEFIVILVNGTRERATKCAEKILEAFQLPFSINNQEFYISSSIGISIYPNDGEDGETLIKNADTALYRVKDLGRGHFQFYSKSMRKGSPGDMKLETALRKAIERNELVLYYQPQFNLKTMQVSSFEALIRWNHPTLGFVSPGEFIPLAEETGLIFQIGEWVIKTVCQNVRDWQTQGYNPVSVGINLSSKQFQQAGLVDYIQHTIAAFGVDPTQLEFELTEGAMQDAKEALLILNKLKELGVRISVDDFGTGYSSLSYLKRFPIDNLKIDQSFVKDVLHDEKDVAITTTIIHLAESLKLDVIAEGVEELEQVEFFKKMNCHKAQGFYFSRPLPEAEMIEHYFTRKKKT